MEARWQHELRMLQIKLDTPKLFDADWFFREGPLLLLWGSAIFWIIILIILIARR